MLDSSFKLDIKTGPLIPSVERIRIATRHGVVGMIIGNRSPLEMTTIQAHRTGYDIVLKAEEAEKIGALVKMTINGSDVDLLPSHARQIGAGLLRKADAADDFQIQHFQRKVRL